MNYRTLGRTGLSISEVSLGGAYLIGDDADRALENVSALVRRAHELGINYIDTAPVYCNGRSEELLGGALKGMDRPFFVASKVGYDPEDFDYRRDSVLWSLERSLGRLGIPRLTVAQFHDNQATWERITEPAGALEGLREAQKRGLCEYIGVTGRALPLLLRLVEVGEFDTVLVYHDYHPCSRTADRLLASASAHGMGVIIASVLAGGLFGHPWRRDRVLSRMGQDEAARARRVIERLQREPGTLAQSAYRYVLADPRVSTVACGAAKVAELEDVVRAPEMGPLPEEVMAELRGLIEP